MSMHNVALYVVATPIGNMGDLTMRAQEILKQVDCIAVEDSRQSGKLLKAYGIHTKVMTLFEHNEKKQIPKLLSRLQSGQNLALVSDAGTPVIRDPGFLLIRAVHEAGFPVLSVPGPSSLTAAISVAGIPVNRFTFEGFLPAKAPARRQYLQSLLRDRRSLVFFEAPHRILDCLRDCCQILGESRMAAVARELTKLHESVHRGSLGQLTEIFSDATRCKGEMVVIIEGRAEENDKLDDIKALEIAQILNEELPMKKAAALAARISGSSRNKIYQNLLMAKKQDEM